MKDIKEEKAEVKKLSAKRWISYFLLAVCIIIVYKIFDNLRRSLFEISIIFALIYINIIGKILDIDVFAFNFIIILISIIPFILELINYLFGKREGEEKQKTFTPKISGLKGIFARTIITLGCLPYKAYTSLKAIVKTM